MIPTIKTLNDFGEEEEKDLLLKDILDKNKKLESIYEKFPLWFKYVMDLEGLPKSMGRHAAGTLITPTPVTDYCPLCLDKEKNIMIELEMHNAMDDLGLVKMDYLGLETLDVIDDTLKLAGITWEDVDINHLNLEDAEVFNKIYNTGNTVGIFQMESAEAKKMCIAAQVNNVEDIIVINAANRPGTKDSFPIYCKNKLYPNDVVVLHDDLKTLFGKTHFVLLYQEQALQLFRRAGFPEEQVDNARRAIGKKKIDVMEKLEIDFRKGLKRSNWNDEQISEIWALMLKQAEYCFNRGHAVAYGLLSYLTAYLKTHYTIYYMTSLLSSKSDKIEKISTVINDCKRLGIKVLPPNVNKSNIEFTAMPESNSILFGLLAIKGLGFSVVEKIISNRPYSSLKDLSDKILDKKAIVTIIKAGGIPTKNKMESLKKYATLIYEDREYKDVSSLPKLSVLKEKYDIDIDSIKDKESRLKLYNKKRKEEFDVIRKEKFKNYMDDFYKKYAKDEYLWEFETLSMFLTKDPLVESNKYIKAQWDEIDEDEKGVVCCVIVDIKRKKDKNGNQFAYLDLYTPTGIIEATIWSKQLKQYSDLIKKGKCISILGRKREDNHLFVEKIKTYEQWLDDRSLSKLK